jgi:membrane protein
LPPPLRFWLRVLARTPRLWLDGDALASAGSLAFYTLFSMAPVMIIAVTIVGLVFGEDAASGRLVAELAGFVGEGAAGAVEMAVMQSRIEVAGLWPTLLGISALLIGATTVFGQLQQSLNQIWGVMTQPRRSGLVVLLWHRLWSLLLVFLIGAILLVSLLAGLALQAMVVFAADWLPARLLTLADYDSLLSIVVLTTLFAVVYRVLPDVLLGWRAVLPGALLAATLFVGGRSAIAWYFMYTATASTWGAAGSVVMLLLWVYASALMLLLGAAFNRALLEVSGERVRPGRWAVRARLQPEPDR